MGMQIAEGYGMTETSAASFVNRIKAYRYGTVGWPLPGTEVRIADDGEVLLRGAGNMEGYHNNDEATAETIDVEGWLHTGDIGELDERGFLRITDRKKDMFKTSGGKYVAPSNIESMFKGLCPYASQLVVYGADRNFVSALVTLDPEAIAGWGAQHGMEGKPLRRDRLLRRLPRDGAGLHRPAQRGAEPLGDDQEVHHPRERPDGRERRAHAQPEAQAQGGLRQVQAPPRRPLRRAEHRRRRRSPLGDRRRRAVRGRRQSVTSGTKR